MKKARICLAVVCVLMAASCGQSDTPVDTSGLTDREREWVEFSYAHERDEDVKRMWEQLRADDVKSYVREQRHRLCGDMRTLAKNLKEAAYEAGEAQEYTEKTAQLLC
ncbi:hypothetical protein [Streptomyces sp. NTK 937]|uniref:hypothetical protein n=1 Tax=Streptomyces TaxID=1883 RepID=UPI0004A96A78|nr:hypothetical protein [Streptomyces sp. NTK 937]KDQ69967.1 hypothetical protein DT87_23065 [Streptomyces sp. NTK 937]WSX35577.1 hypothetical protein OG291_07810 [Streptomyces halstedii]